MAWSQIVNLVKIIFYFLLVAMLPRPEKYLELL